MKPELEKAIWIATGNMEYAKFIISRLRIITKCSTNIHKSINRHNLKNVETSCTCINYNNNIKINDHVHIKAINLPNNWEIKNYLTINNKTPLFLGIKQQRDTMLRSLTEFFNDLQILLLFNC
jgi:hypothetical protein